MVSTASSAASGLTTSASEPDRNTVACSAARKTGWIPRSSGMLGKPAAPFGTSRSSASLTSSPSDSGNDADLVAILYQRGQVIQVADVLVVEVDVDEAADLPVFEN